MTNNGAKVFITQEALMRDADSNRLKPRFDLSTAAEYGELVHLASHGNVAMVMGATGKTVIDGLWDFDCERDFILGTGDLTVAIGVGVVLALLNVPYFRLLRWDKRTRGYAIIRHDIAELERYIAEKRGET
jgi:hypothetical protein